MRAKPRVNFTFPELKDLVKAGSMVILHTKTTPLNYNQISDLGLASAEAGVVILCVDAPRFEKFELTNIASNGVRLIIQQ